MKMICEENSCNGCMLCINTCPKEAITIEDSLSALNAVISEDKCINCGKCTKVCPQNNTISMHKPILWQQGWALEPEIRSQSSSGGLATAIALSFYKRGGSCVGCSFSDGNFGYSLAKCEDDILQFRGSKYVKSDPCGAYNLIKDEIKKKKQVLFIGLPCQVAGIKSFIGESEYLFTIDLICHGSPSKKVLQLFLDESGIKLSSVADITFRKNNKFFLTTNGNPILKSGNRDLYMRYYLKSLFYTENCYNCRYSKIDRCSDLTLGDSWGSDLKLEEVDKGVSLVFCNTEKGVLLVKTSYLHLEPVDLNKAVLANTNLSSPSVAPPERKLFFDCLNKKKSFKLAVKKCYPVFYYKYLIREVLTRKRIGKVRNNCL